MADQASVKRFNGAAAQRANSGAGAVDNDRLADTTPADSSENGVVDNMAGFGENLLTLAELQARLTAIEARQNLESLKYGGLLILASAILAIASLPAVLVGIAELLVSEMGMKRGYALLSTATAALLVAGACCAAALQQLRRKPFGFPVASEELTRNLNWLRTVLRHSGRWRLNR